MTLYDVYLIIAQLFSFQLKSYCNSYCTFFHKLILYNEHWKNIYDRFFIIKIPQGTFFRDAVNFPFCILSIVSMAKSIRSPVH